MAWQSFYKSGYTSWYGETAGRPNPHRGVDRAGYPGQAVPSFVSGRVIVVVKNSVVGWYVVVNVSPGRNIGFCHMRAGSMPQPGTRIKPGDIVGRMAGPGEYTGSAWSGTHVHITDTSTILPTYGPWRNPYPGIQSALSSTAGGGGSVIEDEEEEEEDEMKPVVVKRVEKGYQPEWSIVAPWLPGGYEVTGSTANAKAFARLFDAGFGNEMTVNREDYIAIQKMARFVHEKWLKTMKDVYGDITVVNEGGSSTPVGPLTINLTGSATPKL